MEFFLQQTFSGLAFGGVYACMALAVVMIYQATDHLNFAQGEMAMFSTYVAFTLLSVGIPYWWAFLLAMAISFVGGLLVERIIVRPVEGTSVLNEVIVFIGLLAIFNSLAGWIWDYTIKPFPSPFPKEPLFGNKFVGTHDLGVIGVTLVVLFAVFLFFRFTPIGLAMRAAAQDPAGFGQYTDIEQPATRRAAFEDITGNPAKGSSDCMALLLQRGGNIPVRIADNANTWVLGVTGQVHRFPGNAKADGYFRAQWLEINATAERVDQPRMPLVAAIVAYRPAKQTTADGKPGADMCHAPRIRAVHCPAS